MILGILKATDDTCQKLLGAIRMKALRKMIINT